MKDTNASSGPVDVGKPGHNETMQASAPYSGSAPYWSNEQGTSIPARIRARLGRAYDRHIRCRGNVVTYLRFLGVRMGSGVSILNAPDDFGTEPWLIEIGDRVTITRGVTFATHDGSSRLFRHLVPEGNRRYGNRFAPIRVLDDSFVGFNSIILPGVTIGPNSIVGAGSVVTKDVPAGMVAAGNPARVLFSLEEYVARYRETMIPVQAMNRDELRRELTERFYPGSAR